MFYLSRQTHTSMDGQSGKVLYFPASLHKKPPTTGIVCINNRMVIGSLRESFPCKVHSTEDLINDYFITLSQKAYVKSTPRIHEVMCLAAHNHASESRFIN